MNRVLALTIAVVVLGAASAHGQDSGDSQEGLAFAQKACAECHVVTRAEANTTVSAAPSFVKIANSSGITAMALSAALQSSHPNMPNLVLDAKDKADVIAYILSLRE
jgi:mono/diheme cytochrome c family protein